MKALVGDLHYGLRMLLRAPGTTAVALLARRFWPGESAVGKHLGGRGEMFEIVGVVGNVRHMDVTKEPPVEVFFHWPQSPPPR